MLTDPIVVIILQYMRVSNHPIVHLNLHIVLSRLYHEKAENSPTQGSIQGRSGGYQEGPLVKQKGGERRHSRHQDTHT